MTFSSKLRKKKLVAVRTAPPVLFAERFARRESRDADADDFCASQLLLLI